MIKPPNRRKKTNICECDGMTGVSAPGSRGEERKRRKGKKRKKVGVKEQVGLFRVRLAKGK